jgi:hypothetical protein
MNLQLRDLLQELAQVAVTEQHSQTLFIHRLYATVEEPQHGSAITRTASRQTSLRLRALRLERLVRESNQELDSVSDRKSVKEMVGTRRLELPTSTVSILRSMN